MHHFKIIFFLFLSLLAFSSKAQLIRLSDKPETFITDIQTVMATDNNAIAIATGKKIESYWTSRFSAEQKTALISTCRKMGTRGHKMAQFYFFFTILDKCIEQEKFSDEKVSSLINITEKFVELYDIKTATKMLEILKDFLENRRLYSSNFNRLYALGGNYEFLFLDTKANVNNAPVNPQAKPSTEPTGELETPKYFDDWDTPPTDDAAIASAKSIFASMYASDLISFSLKLL